MLRTLVAALVAVPYRLRFKRVGKRPRFFAPLLTRGASRIELGDDVYVEAFASLSAARGGSLRIGSEVEIGSFARVDADTGSITIGDRSSVNAFCLINGYGHVRIGDGVRIASHCVILSSTHVFNDAALPIEAQGVTREATMIGDDVWLGAHVVVVGGVEIGAHSVIGAGSVVRADVPPWSVAAGAPARVIRSRNPEQANTDHANGDVLKTC